MSKIIAAVVLLALAATAAQAAGAYDGTYAMAEVLNSGWGCEAPQFSPITIVDSAATLTLTLRRHHTMKTEAATATGTVDTAGDLTLKLGRRTLAGKIADNRFVATTTTSGEGPGGKRARCSVAIRWVKLP